MTLIILVVISVFVFLVLPPASRRVEIPPELQAIADRTVAGAYHVHTTRSDGARDKADICSAAARAGLRFVIFTDHGDGTRPPDPPAYIDGVLALDAVEVSTDDGHYVAIDMPRAPYPLGGAGEAVVEDVARLGGFGIAAHPDSPKRELRWTDDTAPIDGIEWLNADSEWRDEGRPAIARAGLAYFFRPAPSLATLLDRPVTLDRWDRLTRTRPVTALAGLDAHGGIGRRTEEGSRSGIFGIPSYNASFRTFSTRVVLDRPLTGEAAGDARAMYDAIRRGHVFTSIDALAAPAVIDFHAEALGDARHPPATIPMGGTVAAGTHGDLVARASLPAGGELVLLNDGTELLRGNTPIRWPLDTARGAVRVEVHLPRAPGVPPVPWLVSNPIYVGVPAPQPRAADRVRAENTDGAMTPLVWHIEKDASSSAILRTDPKGGAALEYRLAPGQRSSQFVALGADLPRSRPRVIQLTLAADRPGRVSIQVRDAANRRWGRSVYVDSTARRVVLSVASLRPMGPEDPRAIENVDLRSLLLVVDLTNAAPGWRGTVQVFNNTSVQ